MSVAYVTKSLTVASSTGLGGISTAATPVTTLKTSALDTGRRLSIVSTAATSTAASYTVVGIIEGGGTQTETIIGTTAASLPALSVWDYVSIVSIVMSSNANTPISFGTSSMGGTPWRLTDWTKATQALSAAITFSTSANGMTGQIDITLSDPTNIFDDPAHTAPPVFNSTALVGQQCSTNTFGPVAVDAGGALFPVAAWRLTISSSAVTAGSVSAGVMQAGV